MTNSTRRPVRRTTAGPSNATGGEGNRNVEEGAVEVPQQAQQPPQGNPQVNQQVAAVRPLLLSRANTNPYTTLSDITTEAGRRLWKSATEPLDEKFDGSHQGYQVFIANITNRFKMCNWFRFITFTIDNVARNLITNPGLIPVSQIHQAMQDRLTMFSLVIDPEAAAVDDINGYNQAVIEELHCTMIYHFLVNSITTPLKTHISQKINSGLVQEDGPLLLKFIQEKVRGRANKQAVLNARSALHNLSLKEFKFNVKKLHDHVNSQVLTISGNGGTVQGDGITAALLNAYKSCNNEEFLHHIRHIQALADDRDEDIDYNDLMVKAETKYDVLVQTKVWGKKDPRDEQILALQAKLKSLNPSSNRQGKQGKSSGSGKQRRQYEKWQYDPPKNNKKHITKEIKGKQVDFWWCDALKMWARHKPEDCRAKNRSGQNQPAQGSNGNTGSTSQGSNTQNGSNGQNPPRLQASNAFTMEEGSSSETE